MRPLTIRPVATASSGQIRLLLRPSRLGSRRVLSSTSINLEESKPAPEVERLRGIPIAFDLGGINISTPSLAQRLAARLHAQVKPESDGKSGISPSSAKGPNSRASGSGWHSGTQPRPAGSASRSKNFRQGDAGVAPRKAQATGSGQALGWGGMGRPPSQRPLQNIQQRPPLQDGQRPPFRAGQRTGVAKTGRGKDGALSPNRRKNGPKRQRTRMGSSRQSKGDVDPELDDYPEGSSRRPPRTYGDDGLLKLKGVHAQLNQVIRPTLPKLPSSSLSFVAKASSESIAESTLQIVPYLDRAAPATAAQPGRNVLSVVDNAQLALSRVRDLGVRNRRDALDIVQKMADPPKDVQRDAVAQA